MPDTTGQGADAATAYVPVKQDAVPAVNNNTNTQKLASPYGSFAYDATLDADYQAALKNLTSAQQQKPTYAGTYDGKLDDLYSEILSKPKFRYDASTDALYQNARQQYVSLGQAAMQDAMGKAAALTGGYGSSYSQSVGQQAYNAYLQQLNSELSDYYAMAQNQYNDEVAALYDRYNLLGDLQNREYSQYQDDLSRYYAEVSRLQGIADDAYNRGFENFYNSQQLGLAQQEQAYDRLVSLMTNMGYNPSAEELEAAGMSQAQADAYRTYYLTMVNPGSSGSGGGGYGGGGGSSKKSTSTSGGGSSGGTAIKPMTYSTLGETLANGGNAAGYMLNQMSTQAATKPSAQPAKTTGSSGGQKATTSAAANVMPQGTVDLWSIIKNAIKK